MKTIVIVLFVLAFIAGISFRPPCDSPITIERVGKLGTGYFVIYVQNGHQERQEFSSRVALDSWLGR